MEDRSEVSQAVVLAAGKGTRMLPVTEHTPKPLLPFFGVPLVDYAVAHLVRAGVARIAVTASHLGALLARCVVDELAARHPPVSVQTSHEREPLGTGGALARLADWLEDAPWFVVNSDAVFVEDLRRLARVHAQQTNDATLMISRQPAHRKLATVQVDSAGRFEGVAPSAFEGGAVFCGIQIAGPGLLDHLRGHDRSCLFRQGILPWLAEGARIGTFETKDFWADVGTPRRYLDAHRHAFARLDALRELGVFG